jgi:hypothetical protein
MRSRSIFGITIFTIFSIVFIYQYNVDIQISSDEQKIIESHISKSNFINWQNNNEKERELLLLSVGEAANRITGPLRISPPHGVRRGISSSLKYDGGACYDRSYIVEQILTYLNIPFRHIFLSLGKSNSLFKFDLTSHALTEVKIGKRWVLMESLSPHVYKNKQGEFVSAADIAENPKNIEFPNYLEIDRQLYMYLIEGDFKVWYGIYSRNGGFFPPYTIPFDINYQQLLFNL